MELLASVSPKTDSANLEHVVITVLAVQQYRVTRLPLAQRQSGVYTTTNTIQTHTQTHNTYVVVRLLPGTCYHTRPAVKVIGWGW